MSVKEKKEEKKVKVKKVESGWSEVDKVGKNYRKLVSSVPIKGPKGS